MISYLVDKVETQVRICRTCGGSGYETVTIRGQKMRNKCHAAGCHDGKYKVERTEKIPLIQALKEMNLIS